MPRATVTRTFDEIFTPGPEENTEDRRATNTVRATLLGLWLDALRSGNYLSTRDAPLNVLRRGSGRSWVLPRLRVKSPGKPPLDYFTPVGVLYDVAGPTLEGCGLFTYWDYANITMEFDNHMFLQIPWRIGWHMQPEVRSLGTHENLPRVLTRFMDMGPDQFSSLSGRGNFAVAADAVDLYINQRS